VPFAGGGGFLAVVHYVQYLPSKKQRQQQQQQQSQQTKRQACTSASASVTGAGTGTGTRHYWHQLVYLTPPPPPPSPPPATQFPGGDTGATIKSGLGLGSGGAVEVSGQLQLCAWSDPFRFQERDHIEFCAGLCVVPSGPAAAAAAPAAAAANSDADADAGAHEHAHEAGSGQGGGSSVLLSWGLGDKHPRLSRLPADPLAASLAGIRKHQQHQQRAQ
jgi:hypothetical protein